LLIRRGEGEKRRRGEEEKGKFILFNLEFKN